MTDPIAEARALLERSRSPYAIHDILASEALDLLPAVADEADKWREIAIEEQAKICVLNDGHKWNNLKDFPDVRKHYLDQARVLVRAEASDQRKIGKEVMK